MIIYQNPGFHAAAKIVFFVVSYALPPARGNPETPVLY